MAKSENPAEASSRARQARPARFQPDSGLSPDSQIAAGLASSAEGSPDARSAEVRAGRVGALHDRLDGPGLAKARRAALHPDLADTTRSTLFPDQQDVDLLGDEDVLDEAAAARDADHEAFTADAFAGARFGRPRVGGAQVPLANLEPPSSPRIELTPSPVPRVSLTPATGAVDISLVPGPHMAHSRNLPTLAAQHVLGRRHPRRPAAAVTLPPPGDVATVPLELSELAHGVRSSRREVVLGLTIGLGLSLLLAVVGQAYLRENAGGEAVAQTPPTPAELESLTLAARPGTDARGAAWPGPAVSSAGASSAGQFPVSSAGVSSSAAVSPSAAVPLSAPAAALAPGGGAEPPRVATDGLGSEPAHAIAASPSASGAEGQRMLAHPGVDHPGVDAKRSERVLARAGRDSGGRSAARARRAPAIAVEPPAFESEKSLSEGRERTPMSPAESAGLGLDLPL